ncbi:MAG: hypothetical protein HUU46_16470 [Candidatus Hydrogenedentes bacterium]|nr:hypothetical protein [Candidatus Hydrogenedentota bacterium]
MRRLVVQCSCGERIQVPHSALGKAGLCPSCGATIYISKDNAAPYRGTSATSSRSGSSAPSSDRGWSGGGSASDAPEDIRRRFAEGVDLYFAKRYSEALVIFNSLAAVMPHDADIQMGQTMCLGALRKISPLGIAQDGHFRGLPAPHNGNDPNDRLESILRGPTPALDRDFFKRFLFDKMIYGHGDEVQMRAAELAAKMFGFLDAPQPDESASAASEPDIEDEEDEDEPPAYDLPRPTPFRRVAPDDSDR